MVLGYRHVGLCHRRGLDCGNGGDAVIRHYDEFGNARPEWIAESRKMEAENVEATCQVVALYPLPAAITGTEPACSCWQHTEHSCERRQAALLK
jgi:hypothetical protein